LVGGSVDELAGPHAANSAGGEGEVLVVTTNDGVGTSVDGDGGEHHPRGRGAVVGQRVGLIVEHGPKVVGALPAHGVGGGVDGRLHAGVALGVVGVGLAVLSDSDDDLAVGGGRGAANSELEEARDEVGGDLRPIVPVIPPAGT